MRPGTPVYPHLGGAVELPTAAGYALLMRSPNDILSEAMQLPDPARALMARELLASLGPPEPLDEADDEAWIELLAGRARRAADGSEPGVPWTELRESLPNKYRT